MSNCPSVANSITASLAPPPNPTLPPHHLAAEEVSSLISSRFVECVAQLLLMARGGGEGAPEPLAPWFPPKQIVEAVASLYRGSSGGQTPLAEVGGDSATETLEPTRLCVCLRSSHEGTRANLCAALCGLRPLAALHDTALSWARSPACWL